MPIPLGILAAAGRSQAPAGAFDLLESTVLTSPQASLSWTNLTTKYAATYQHLQIRYVTRAAGADNLGVMATTFNGVSSAVYSDHILYGTNGVAVTSSGSLSQNFIPTGVFPTSNDANNFGSGVIDILDSFETTKNKTVRTLSGFFTSTASFRNFIALQSGLWPSTNSVTSITFTPQGGVSFAANTRFSLYGIKATA